MNNRTDKQRLYPFMLVIIISLTAGVLKPVRGYYRDVTQDDYADFIEIVTWRMDYYHTSRSGYHIFHRSSRYHPHIFVKPR